LNPAVTIADASHGGLRWSLVPGYVVAQVGGACLGVLAAHLMFSERLFRVSLHERSGPAQMFSEFVATFRLLSVIWGCSRRRSATVPFAVAAYITSAYWFTASTSFANPAVTIARALTDTFTVGSTVIDRVSDTYGDVEPGGVLAIVGSTGKLEISINRGSAAKKLFVCRTDPVRIEAGAAEL
jgi:glycerol uptake facilitator-like aquaporin